MRGWQPNVKRNDSRLHSESQKEQNEDRALFPRPQLGSQQMEGLKAQVAAGGSQDEESKQ